MENICTEPRPSDLYNQDEMNLVFPLMDYCSGCFTLVDADLLNVNGYCRDCTSSGVQS